MIHRFGVAALLVAASIVSAVPSQGATPKAVINGASEVPAGGMIFLDASKSVSDKPLKWKFKGPEIGVMEMDKGDRKAVYVLVPNAVEGVYAFTLIAKGVPDDEKELDADSDVMTVRVVRPKPPEPIPTPVVPPGPTPPPFPPNPNPDPVIPPTPVVQSGKLRVIIIRESSAKLTPAQHTVFYGPRVSSWLDASTMNDGLFKAWRIYDPQTDTINETTGFKTALVAMNASEKFKSTPLPSLVVFNDTSFVDVFSIVDEADTMARLVRLTGTVSAQDRSSR